MTRSILRRGAGRGTPARYLLPVSAESCADTEHPGEGECRIGAMVANQRHVAPESRGPHCALQIRGPYLVRADRSANFCRWYTYTAIKPAIVSIRISRVYTCRFELATVDTLRAVVFNTKSSISESVFMESAWAPRQGDEGGGACAQLLCEPPRLQSHAGPTERWIQVVVT